MLYEKIKKLYPELNETDFDFVKGTVFLQNDSDGNGDYIESWNHPTLPRPTDEELA